jgi:ATP-grasp domain, R2K clade family 3
MKVYIRKNSDLEFASPNFAVAYDGFRKMGWEIVPFESIENLTVLEPESLVVGFGDDIHRALIKLNINPPTEINYPEELQQFLGRKIWMSSVNYIAKHPELWNVFIKPAKDFKKFKGRVVNSPKDLVSCGDEFVDTEIWCSEPVKFVAEWRCFVRYNAILDVRLYQGDWSLHFDPDIIKAAVAAYKSAPASYAIDFGLTDSGKTLLIEVNDGYSVGGYGLFPVDYAQFLSARWAEMTNTKDYGKY